MILPRLKMNVERWKFSKEYGVYVSTLGNLKDRRKRLIPIKIDKKGYCVIRTEVGFVSVHRLVMKTWKPAPNMETLTIDHLNHNKRDNRLDNLEWVTHQINLERAIEDQVNEIVAKEGQIVIPYNANDKGNKQLILANGVPMTLGQAVDFIDKMGTTGVSRSAICDSIKKALDGKKKGKYAGIKFTRVMN